MQNTIRHANDRFKIECTKHSKTIAEGKTLSRMLHDLFKQLNYHNHGEDSKMCGEMKEKLSMSDLEASFNTKELRVYIPTDFKVQATEWKSDESMLGNFRE